MNSWVWFKDNERSHRKMRTRYSYRKSILTYSTLPSSWTFFSDKRRKTTVYICVKHKKKKRKNFISSSITRSHKEYCQFPQPVTFHSSFLPFFPLTFNYQRSLPPLSPFSLHQVLLPSFFSISPLYLSVYLSVCLSVTRHFTRSLTRSVSHTVRITPIHLVHSLAHSPALADTLVGFLFFFFFFYSIHGDCTCVTTWTCKIGHLSCCLVLFIFFSCEAKKKDKCMWHFND